MKQKIINIVGIFFSGNRDHVTALSGDHIISETKTVRSDGERTDAEEKQKKTG